MALIMNKQYIARIAGEVILQLVTWLATIITVVVPVVFALIVSTEYERIHVLELHRLRKRRIELYAKTNQHTPWTDSNAAEAHAASIGVITSYVVQLIIRENQQPSWIHENVFVILHFWIDYQSTLAWMTLFIHCVYIIIRRCPLHDIYTRLTSEMLVYRFQPRVTSHEAAVEEAFSESTDAVLRRRRIEQGGLVTN